MSTPLFRVGEKVILVSPIRPDLNGIYHIKEHLIKGETYICGETGVLFSTDDANTYNIYLLDGCITCDGYQAYANETSLRKYHDPSDYSFDELMENIKNNTLVDIDI